MMITSGLSMSNYPNVEAWLQRCKEQIDGYAEINDEGAQQFGEVVKEKIGSLE